MVDQPKRLDAAVAICYVAFVFSGVYKSAWYLQWSPIDLTVLFGAATVGVSGLLVARDRIALTRPSLLVPALFGLFAGYAVLSGLWSPSTEYFLSKSLRLVGVTGLALGLGAIVIATSVRRLRYAGFATAGVALLTALEMLSQYYQAGGGEPSPFGTNYLITGRAIGLGLLLAVGYLVLSREDRTLTATAAVGAVVMGYALLISGARGPTVAVVGSIALLVAAGIVLGTLPNGRLALAGYSVAGVASLIALVTVARQLRAIQRLLALVDGPGRSLGLRFGYWTNTLDALHPGMLVLGEGFGAWPVLIDPGSDTRYYPHNMLFEILFELGIVGLVLVGALFGYVVLHAAHDWLAHPEPTHVVLGILLVYMLVNAMVTGDLNDDRYLFAIVGVMAYGVGSRRLGTVRDVLENRTT
ncbi:O-antigen ligase family protein [Natronococcus occultus]|uniref:Lipid A core-O-antigen ligase-like enyme n=1 Tax=Natronococcus occultus SP4 TaxID=694430 RepID=L0K382_9EURY|nr:O-antigen ligase family protein [Natronococcus occultus]AGB39020.1 lipid A core-O-antigen ligase-like enyme [Natronococcus occultus SP4]